MQLKKCSLQVTPASVGTQTELASGSESQHLCGLHIVHEHGTEAEMLEPGGGGGWYSVGGRDGAGCGAPQPRN